jgi:hypothetical protein
LLKVLDLLLKGGVRFVRISRKGVTVEVVFTSGSLQREINNN